MMLYMGRRAREAARELALASTDAKNEALERMAARIELSADKIIEANRQDLEAAQSKGRDTAFLDRLRLDGLRVAAMARGLREVAALADPVGAVMAHWTRTNGLEISRVRVPLGVVGIIYEIATECDRRRRGALPEVGQRGDPAQWLRQLPYLSGHCQRLERGGGCRRAPRSGDPARADN